MDPDAEATGRLARPRPDVNAIGPTLEAVGPAEPRSTFDGQQSNLDPAEIRPTQDDFQQTRHAHAGTRMAGLEGLSEPGSDGPRIRLVPGKVVPGTRYRIQRWLGEGGMGVVYEAEHIDIERRVALKILRFDLSQEPQMAQVFRDEARAASRIGSKNIVEIYDFGELADGRLFFCMELLPGGDLVPASEDDWIEPPRLIGILRQICKGLAAAHDVNIVHRDIKPENIILIDEGGREVVKIVDFGISKMLAAGQEEGGTIAGTPHYMAPEQIRGQRFDGRLDMYALGCMAYELLVGHPPFMAEAVQDLLKMQLREQPKPLLECRPDRDIPKQLAAVIMKCLAKDPEQRYRDMRDLEAALCEAQIAAGLTTPWDDLPLPDVELERREKLLREMPSPLADLRPPERNRWLWPALAAAAALLLGVGVTWAILGGKPTQEQLDEIDALTQDARIAAGKTQWVFPPPEQPDAPTSFQKVLALEGLEGKADAAGDERAEELRKEFAETLRQLGQRYWDVPGARPFARDYYVMSLLFDPEDVDALERSGQTLGMIADFRERAAKGEFTEDELRTARWLDVLALDDKDEAEERAKQLIAQDMSEAERSGGGSTFVQSNALRAARGAGLQVPVEAPPALADPAPIDEPAVADADLASEDTDEAAAETGGEIEAVPEETARKGGKKPRKRGGDDDELAGASRDPNKARELAEQGMAALQAGRREEAKGLFNQAIAYDQRNAMALSGLSDVYFDTGSDQKAVLYAEKAVKAAPSNSNYRLKLGDAYYKVLRYRDALEQYNKAKELGATKADARISKVQAKLGG